MPNPKDLRDLHRQLVSDGIIDMGYKQFESIATAKGKEGVQNRQDLHNIAREGGYFNGDYKAFSKYFAPVNSQKKEQMKQQVRQATGRQAHAPQKPAQQQQKPAQPAATPQGQRPKPVQASTPNKPDSVVQQYMPTVNPTYSSGKQSRVRPQQGTGVLKTDAQIMRDDSLSAADKVALINDNRRRRGQRQRTFNGPAYEETARDMGVVADNPVEEFTDTVESARQPDPFFTDNEGNVLGYKEENYVNKSPVTEYNDRIKEIADEINYYNTYYSGGSGKTRVEAAIDDAYAKYLKGIDQRGLLANATANVNDPMTSAYLNELELERTAGIDAVAEAAYQSFPQELKNKYGEDVVRDAVYQVTFDTMKSKARPKNFGQYLAHQLSNTVPGIINKALVRGGSGSSVTLSDISDMASSEYAEQFDNEGLLGAAKTIAGEVLPMAADPTMFIPFGGPAAKGVVTGLGKLAAKKAVGRGLESGAVKLATKAAGSQFVSRGLSGAASNAVQMAAYEEAVGLASMANGSGQSFWDVTGGAIGTGLKMAPIGFIGPTARVVKGRAATAIADNGLRGGSQWAANTGAKLGISTGAFITEAGVFAAPDIIGLAINGTYTNEQAKDIAIHSIGMLAGFKAAGFFNPMHIAQTKAMVRNMVKGTMGTELALNRHDAEALRRLGYGEIQGDNIMNLFVPLGERPEAKNGGGYFSQYSQIVLDERVPWSTRAKLIYIATGKLPETGVRPNQVRITTDENGRTVVTTLQGDNPISQRFFSAKHKASAESYYRKASHDVERMNFEGTKQDIMSEHLGGMFKSKLVNDALAKDQKDRTPEEQKLVEDYNHEVWVVNDLMLGVDKWRVENEDKLPDPEKALKKPEWERTDAEKQAVQRYGERLNKTLHDILRDNYADMAADLAWRDATEAADEMSNKRDGKLYQCQLRGEEGVWYTVVDFDGTIEQGETGMDVTPGANGDKMMVRNMGTGEVKMVTLSELTTLSTDRYIEVRNSLGETMYNNYTEEFIRNRRKALAYGKQPQNAEVGQRLTLASDEPDANGLRPEYVVVEKDAKSGTCIVEDANGNRKLINGHDIQQLIGEARPQIPASLGPQAPPQGPQTPPPAAPQGIEGERLAFNDGDKFTIVISDDLPPMEVTVVGRDTEANLITVRNTDGSELTMSPETLQQLHDLWRGTWRPAQESPVQPQGQGHALPEQGDVFKLKVGDEFKDAEVTGVDDTGIIVRYEQNGMFRTEHLTPEELAPRLEQPEAPAAPVTPPAQGEGGAPAAPVADDGIPRDENGKPIYHRADQKTVEDYFKSKGLEDDDVMPIADAQIRNAQKDLDDATAKRDKGRQDGDPDATAEAIAVQKDAQERLDWWNNFKEGYGKEEEPAGEGTQRIGNASIDDVNYGPSAKNMKGTLKAVQNGDEVTFEIDGKHQQITIKDSDWVTSDEVIEETEGGRYDRTIGLSEESLEELQDLGIDKSTPFHAKRLFKGRDGKWYAEGFFNTEVGPVDQIVELSPNFDINEALRETKERRAQKYAERQGRGGEQHPIQESEPDIPQDEPRNMNIPNAPVPEKVPDATTPEEKEAAAAANAKRYNEADKLEGYRVQITLPNGEKVIARYKVVSHDVVIPSHDPFNGYRSTPGYAEDAEGRNVNDRDYSDPNYQFENEKKAQNYDGRAITEPPVVNSGDRYGGSVLGGNDRTMAGQLAAVRGTDIAYLDALDYNINQYGISRRALREFMERNPHARLVLEVEGEMPMTTESMAKFNQSGMKSSGTAQSTNKVRRLLTDKEIRDLAGIIGTSTDKTFGDLSRSPSVAAGILRVLKEAGIILENEQAEFLRANGSLSRKGEALLQEIVRASILDERGIKALETASDDYNLTDIEQRIDQITPSLIRNAALGEMSLRNEISRAIEHIRQTYEGWANGKKRGLKGSKKDALVAAANATGGSIEFDAKTEEEIASEQTSRILSLVFGTFSKEDAIKFFNEYERMAKTAQRSQEGFGGLFGETIGRVDILKELAKKYGLKVKEDNEPEQGQGQPGETETPGGNGGGNQGDGRPSGRSGQSGEGTGRGEGPVTPPRPGAPGAPQGGGEPPKGEGEPPKPEEPGKPAGGPAGGPAASEPHQLTVDEINGLNISQSTKENAIDYVNGDRGPRARIAYQVALKEWERVNGKSGEGKPETPPTTPEDNGPQEPPKGGGGTTGRGGGKPSSPRSGGRKPAEPKPAEPKPEGEGPKDSGDIDLGGLNELSGFEGLFGKSESNENRRPAREGEISNEARYIPEEATEEQNRAVEKVIDVLAGIGKQLLEKKGMRTQSELVDFMRQNKQIRDALDRIGFDEEDKSNLYNDMWGQRIDTPNGRIRLNEYADELSKTDKPKQDDKPKQIVSPMEPTVKNVVYKPNSKGKTNESIIPASMAQAVNTALGKINGGDTDGFVLDKCGFKDKDELYEALNAEQIDGVALAISAIERGEGLILGDMTGIGKGRQLAAVMRYASKEGIRPVFVTEKPGLFKDMMRDLLDVGADTPNKPFRPLIIASADNGDVTLSDGSTVKAADAKTIEKLLSGDLDKLAKGYDALFVTYANTNNVAPDAFFADQNAVKKEKTHNEKTETKEPPELTKKKLNLIAKWARGSIVVMDEAHNAAGTDSNQAVQWREIIDTTSGVGAKGVVMASATYAKTPKNYVLYALRTPIKEAHLSNSQLLATFTKGGVPLQEWLASQLTGESYIRRERDMTGVNFDYRICVDGYDAEHPENSTPEALEKVKAIRKSNDKAANIANIMLALDNKASDAFKKIKEVLVPGKGQKGGSVSVLVQQADGTYKEETINAANYPEPLKMTNSTFSAKIAAVNAQLFMAEKAESAADAAIKAIENGEMPMIVFENTFDALMKDLPVDENGVLKSADYAQAFVRYLEQLGNFTIKLPKKNANGAQEILKCRINLSGDPDFALAKRMIETDGVGLHVSPVDRIRERLEEAGYKVGELSGREFSIQKLADGKYHKVKRKTENPDKVTDDYNTGKIDVLLINGSGSTGRSMHEKGTWSEDGKTKIPGTTQSGEPMMMKPRHQIYVQNFNNETTMVQAMGRIDRTGQVEHGRYTFLMTPVPAETNILMRAQRKREQLKANTTAQQDRNSFDAVNASDFINKYGDQVVAEYLENNPKIAKALQIPLKVVRDGTGKAAPGLAKKATANAYTLTCDQQQEFYDDVQAAYDEYVKVLKENGDYDLETQVVDLQAETLAEHMFVRGSHESDSMFSQDTNIARCRVKVQRKPMKVDEIEQHIAEVTGAEDKYEYEEKFQEKFDKHFADMEAEVEKEFETKEKNVDNDGKKNDKLGKIRAFKSEAQRLVKDFPLDLLMPFYSDASEVNDAQGRITTESMPHAIVYDVKLGRTLGSSTIVFAVNDGRQKVAVRMNDDATFRYLRRLQIMPGENFDRSEWNKSQGDAYEDAFIITGNLIGAYHSPIAQRGRMIRYTDSEGNQHTGILMPRNFKTKDVQVEKPISEFFNQLMQFARFRSTSKDTLPVFAGGQLEVNNTRYNNEFFFTAKGELAKRIDGDPELEIYRTGKTVHSYKVYNYQKGDNAIQKVLSILAGRYGVSASVPIDPAYFMTREERDAEAEARMFRVEPNIEERENYTFFPGRRGKAYIVHVPKERMKNVDASSEWYDNIIRELNGKGLYGDTDKRTTNESGKRVYKEFAFQNKAMAEEFVRMVNEEPVRPLAIDEKAESAEPNWEEVDRSEHTYRFAAPEAQLTGDDIAKDFGFRGVDTGNTSAEGVRDLHNAFMTMAMILNIDPRSLSLGGNMDVNMLGPDAASREFGPGVTAHFKVSGETSSYTGRTQKKMQFRAGESAFPLAHEWFHALDNYFGAFGLKNEETGFYEQTRHATENADKEGRPWTAREEIREAFNGILRSLVESGFYGRLENEHFFKGTNFTDSSNRPQYWGKRTEMLARAFEAYMRKKITENEDNLRIVTGNSTTGRKPTPSDNYVVLNNRPTMFYSMDGHLEYESEIRKYCNAHGIQFDGVENALLDITGREGGYGLPTNADSIKRLKAYLGEDRAIDLLKSIGIDGEVRMDGLFYSFDGESSSIAQRMRDMIADGSINTSGEFDPTPEEEAVIDKAFDKFFETIREKRDVDTGRVIMYEQAKPGETKREATMRETRNLNRVLARTGLANSVTVESERDFAEGVFANTGRPLRTLDGIVYGYTDSDGNIHLNAKYLNFETPIHEYGHLWSAWAKKSHGDLWQRGIELAKESDAFKRLKEESKKKGSVYNGMTDDQLADEVLADVIGKKGQDMYDPKDWTRTARVRHWLTQLWHRIGEALGFRKRMPNMAVGDMSFDDIIRTAAGDILSGKRLKDTDPDDRGPKGRRFSSKGSVPTFYSNAAKAVENVKQNKATAEQWKAMLTKQGGIKAGEDKWMGLSTWLDEHKGETLTKDEVLEFVRDNGITMEEVGYSEAPDTFESLKREYDQWLHDEGFDYAQEQLRERFGDDADIAFDDLGGELVVANEEAAAAVLGSENIINSTRLDYTTDGLENKREIAFVVPDVEPYQENDVIHFGPENEGRAIMWVRFGETTDTEGNRVLVIDEIQSNRHQDAREKGYKVDENTAYTEYKKAIADYKDAERRGDTAAMRDAEKRYELYGAISGQLPGSRESYQGILKGAVPAAPFEKNWHEVAMKRMLRLAAEEGFDKVAWTTGKQQNDRYNLATYISKIEKERRNASTLTVDLTVRDTNGLISFDVDKDGIITHAYQNKYSETVGKPLADVIGKEVADEVLHSRKRTFNMDEMEIGGEGMKGFYDGILPQFMNKYGKKWGVKVGEVTIDTPDEETMHSVDITPEMRESVITQGQPLFQARSNEQIDRYPNGEIKEVRNYDDDGNLRRLLRYDENRQLVRHYQSDIGTDLTRDENGVMQGMSNGVEMKPYNFRFQQVTKAQDKEYADAVEKKDDAAAQKLVDDAAKSAGMATDESGKLIDLYHGTDRFGFTIFDRLKSRMGAFFTSTRSNVAANYAGDDHYARVRKVNKGYKQDDSQEGILNNARSVFDQDWKMATEEEKQAIVTKVEADARKIADEIDKRKDDANPLPADDELDIVNAAAWVEDLFYTVAYARENGNEGEDLYRLVSNGVDMYNKNKQAVRDYVSKHYDELDEKTRDYLNYLTSYESGDVAIDISSSYKNILSGKDLATVTGDSLITLDKLKEITDETHNIGSYHLYGHLGDNPLIVDAEGKNWYSLEYDGRKFDTDTLAQYAKENGYTALVVKNVYDYGDKADDYIFFEPSQLKSADPATYDDNGNLIPLSQRFDRSKNDLRYQQAPANNPAGSQQGNNEQLHIAREYAQDRTRTTTKLYEEVVENSVSLRHVLEDIARKSGKPIADYENVYLAENQSHGMMTTELITFRDRRVNPLNDALRKLAKHYGGEPTKNYVWARHGIERSIYVCFRERAYELAEKEAEAAARARGEEVTDKDINDAYNAMLDELYNATSAYSRRAYLESLETECANILSAHGDTKPFEVTDKAGLTALNDKRSLVDDKPIENAWEIVKEYENNAGAEGEADVEALFDRLNDISKSMLDYSRDKGMMDKDTVEKIRKMFRFYVPLQGFAEGTMAQDYFEYVDSNPMRAGRAVPNTPKMRGRGSESADPIATLVRNAEMTIAAARRNTVATHLYNLATSRDTDLFAPARAWEAYDAAEDTWVPSTPDFTGCETTKDMMDAIRLHDEQMRQQRELGLAREARRGFSNRLITAQGAPKGLKMSMRQRHEHAVPVRINGKENVIYVLSDPRIAQIVNGTDKGSVDKNNAPFFYQANKLKRIQSGLMTSYNIAFWFANGARDIQNAFLRQAIMNGGGAAARTALQGLKGDPLGVIPWEALNLYNKAVKGTLDESNKHERYFKEFFEHGGITGYAFADQVEVIQNRVKKLLEHPKTNPRRLMFAVGELMEKAGGAFEIAPRFATYVASRDGGKSIMQAVSDAKESTVNFDRRGARRTWAMRAAAAFYAFLNPGIQGMQNRLHQVRTNPGKTTLLHAAGFVMGYLWKGAAVACLMALGRKDDEYDTQLTEYDRRNNICIPVGDDDWVKIPINMEDRVLFGLGDAVRNGADFFEGNRYIGGEGKDEYAENDDWLKYAGIVSAWFPIDIGSENNFIPTSLQPIYDVYINKKDFRGNSVDWRNDYNSQLPEYQRANPYVTSKTMMNISKWWSEANGGDEVTRAQNKSLHGWDEINPQHMQYLLQSYLGGLGTTIGQVVSLAETIGSDDDDVKYSSFKFPIANRFWKGNLKEYSSTKDERKKARIWTNWANEISRRDREYRKRGAGREGSDNTLSKEAMENYEENLKYLELAKEIEKLARKKSQAKTKATKEGRTLTDEENKEFDNSFWEQIPDFEQKYLDIDGKRKVPEWRKHYDDD